MHPIAFFKIILLITISSTFLFSCANIERVGSNSGRTGSSSNSSSEDLPYRKQESTSAQEVQVLNPAVQSLLNQARKQKALGQLDLASSTVERALRISPSTPQLHYFLAKLKFSQNQVHNALQLALKGQSLLGSAGFSLDDDQLSKDFWQLIGDCYTRLGNALKASQSYSHL